MNSHCFFPTFLNSILFESIKISRFFSTLYIIYYFVFIFPNNSLFFFFIMIEYALNYHPKNFRTNYESI